MIEKEERYLHLNKWLKQKFGERVLKICVDGGFTCPNRDGTCGKGGCIFCSGQGSGEHIKLHNIEKQILNHLESYRGERANKFLVYFQNFSNTYDKIENLKKKYDCAFVSEKIVGLDIATRPDCINEEIVALLKSYKERGYVCVELGLQTSNEETAKAINRGYKNEIFTTAVKLLNKNGIDVIVHIMRGLPNENLKDIEKTINFINKIQILVIISTIPSFLVLFSFVSLPISVFFSFFILTFSSFFPSFSSSISATIFSEKFLKYLFSIIFINKTMAIIK